jgi:phosphoribosylanthranilate isomerase
MRVKICGITTLLDAFLAIDAGADALGFVFVKKSKRYIAPMLAAKIISRLPPYVSTVAVVAGLPRHTVRDIVRVSGATTVQFHGAEKPAQLLKWDLPVYKAFRVMEGFSVEMLGKFPGPAYLLDAGVPGYLGGTGRTFDWTIAADAGRFGRIIIAGGITARNVCEAIRIANPYAIDVSSGVESSPGVKDRQKLKEFFAAIRGVQ